MKSFKSKYNRRGPGSSSPWTDFKGESRSNDTHESTSDPEAQLVRKDRARKRGCALPATPQWKTATGRACYLICIRRSVHPSWRWIRWSSLKTRHRSEEGRRRPRPPRSDFRGRPARTTDRAAANVAQRPQPEMPQQDRRNLRLCEGHGVRPQSRYYGVERTHAQSQYVRRLRSECDGV